jgi:AraC-like DNA-binding protein
VLIKLIDIINSLSCFQLILFTFYLLHKGRNFKPNLILTVFFIVQFIVILNFLLISVFWSYTKFCVNIAYIAYPFEFLWGPLMFFYVRALLKKEFRFKPIDLINLLPFIVTTGFVAGLYYVHDYEHRLKIFRDNTVYYWYNYVNILYYVLLFGYNFYSLYLLIKYQRGLKEYCSFSVRSNLVWLKIVLYGYIIACIINAFTYYIQHYIPISYEIKMLVIFSPFLVYFNILFYKSIIHPYVIIQPDEKPKYSGSGISGLDLEKYYLAIEKILSTEKLHLNPTLTLKDLSESTGISERVLSQVINQQNNQNFFTFINSLRIEEAKRLLKEVDKDKITMIGIAFDSGFNSKSAFYDAFKKHMGMTPSEYRNSIA